MIEPMAAALENLSLDREWISTILNYPLSQENLEALTELFQVISDEKEPDDKLKENIESYLQGLANSTYELCLFGKISDIDVRRIAQPIVTFYNAATMIGSGRLQQTFKSIQYLLENSFSIMEALDLIRQISSRLAPLLGQTSVEASASQLFLKNLDKYYSDLREESRQ